jgi:hypothetical protein
MAIELEAEIISEPKTRTAELHLLELLELRGFAASIPGKLVRHQHNKYPVVELLRNGWLDLYQSYQGRDVFKGCRQIVSLYGLTGTRAMFHGVYRVNGVRPASEGEVLADCPWSFAWNKIANHFYELERDTRFDEFKDRIVVEWGRGARSWVQNMDRVKPIIEISAPRRTLPPFEDYLEFSLSFSQLRSLFENEDAHREWRSRLSAVAGVYLILVESTGDLYVGSACGAQGIWGRWRDYANTGHGGNVKLRELVESKVNCPEAFRFSILQILPKTMAKDEVISRECIYKNKLGSRATGLNRN